MDDEQALTGEIVELASRFGRYGYRRVTALLRDRGWQANHKRVERLWRQAGLKVPAKQPKRGRLWLSDGSCIRLRPAWKNHVWAYDFVQIRTHDGRGVRLLAVMDEYTRECLAIRAERRLRSADVIETLAELMMTRGVLGHIRSDNGPEFTAKAVREWQGSADALHRARLTVGERVHREFQWKAEGRATGQGDLLHVAGGEGADRAVQTDLQPGQTPQLPGLQAAAGDLPTCRSCSGARRCNITSGTNVGGRSSPAVQNEAS